MKDELHSVLDKLLPELLNENVEPNVICWRLHLSGHLSKDEHDIVFSKRTTTQRFLVMFELLKSKPDNTFIRLQEICIEMGWMGVLNLIHSTISVIERFHDLIIEEGKDVRHKYGTSMNENLRNVLDILMHEFLKSNADPDSICSKLLLSGHLVKGECDMAESTKMTTAKFILLFTCLKSKPEHVFKRLQEICIETDLIALYKVVQSKLAAIETCSHLMMTEEEFIFYHERNKEHPNIQNWESTLFDVQDPAVNYVGRDQQLNELHDIMQRSAKEVGKDANKKAIIDKTSAVTGLSGIGKTQLVLRYIQLYRQHYDNNIVWINAESDATLKNSFIDLAEHLKINLKNVNGVEKELSVIVRDVYTHFSKVKCLFVFDNADAPLKDEFYSNGQAQINILITSRYQKWGRINSFHLGNFSPEEASHFIRIALKINTDDGNEQVAHLAKTLHFFPLALKQATAYIIETNEIKKNIGATYSIDDYIKEYNESKEKLLNYKFDTDCGNEYFQTTFTTWKMTIDKLYGNTNSNSWVQKLKKRYPPFKKKTAGNIAINILDCISYLAHGQLDMQIFVQHENNEKIDVAIQLLKQYSLVTEQNGLFTVHPLIQEATRLNIKQQGVEKKTFTTVCRLIQAYFERLERSNDYYKQKILLQHSETLLQEMKNWLIKNPSQRKHIEQENIKNLLTEMSGAYFRIGQPRLATSLLEQLLDVKIKQYGPNHYEIGHALVDLSNAYGALGQPDKEKTLLEKGLGILEKHYGPNRYEAATTLANLGDTYGVVGQAEKQKTLLEIALVEQAKHYGLNHYKVAIALVNLSRAYENLGEHEKQKTFLKKALAILEKHYAPDHYEIAITLVDLSNAYGALGRPEKQTTLLKKALPVLEKHYGPDHYEIAPILANLGNAYGALGQAEKQKNLLEIALVKQAKHYGLDHYKVAIALVNLSKAYENLGQHEKQKTFLEKALAILEKHDGPDHYEIAITLIDLSNAYGGLGQPEKQATLLEKALPILEKRYGSDHFEIAPILANLGNAYGALGQTEKQKTMLEKALPILEKHYGPDHYEIAPILANLGNAYGALYQAEK